MPSAATSAPSTTDRPQTPPLDSHPEGRIIGFGFRRFAHYRIRVLLYAGRPNWDLLAAIDPAEIR
jgi:hypothetical protein